MTSKLGWKILGVGVGLLIGATGCGEEALVGGGGSVADGAPELSIDLDDPLGGMDAVDEPSGFGDSYFSDALGDDVPVTDVLTDGGDVEETPRGTVLYLRAVWGRQTEPPTTDESTQPDCGSLQWDGSLSVSDGAIRPMATIRFEKRGDFADSLHLPRDDRSVLAWGSTTGCGRDGVLIKIVIPAAGDTLGNGDGLTPDDTITFETAPLTIAFDLADVADLDTTVMVDGDNGVRFVGFDRDDVNDACVRGVVEGVWAQADSAGRPGGFFRAAWLTPRGRLFGHVRGRWGTTDDGNNVFVGKIINRNGGYEGHVRGHWQRAGNGFGGTFHGKWFVVAPTDSANTDARAEIYRGSTRGFWRGRPDAPPAHGLMGGVWMTKCNGRDPGEDKMAME